MIALYIIAGLALLVFIILNLRLQITVLFSKVPGETENFVVYEGIGPFRVKALPEKEKKIRLSDFSAENYRRMVALAAEADSNASDADEDSIKKQAQTLVSKELGGTLDSVMRLLEKFAGFLYCDIIKVRISVGTGDAALTALACTGVQLAVDFVLGFIDNNAVLRLKSPKSVIIAPDFASSEFSGDIKLRVSIRVIDFIKASVKFAQKEAQNMIRKGHKK